MTKTDERTKNEARVVPTIAPGFLCSANKNGIRKRILVMIIIKVIEVMIIEIKMRLRTEV